MITGDASVNANASILCCTAEILSQRAMRLGAHFGLNDIVIDEFHYYSDKERGVAWQLPLLIASNSRFLLMSATLGETAFFEECLTRLNSLPTAMIKGSLRPVPLLFEYSERPLHEAIEELITKDRAPIYLVSFTQRECAEEAQNFLSVDYCSKEEKKKIQKELENVSFSSPYGKEIQKLLKHGIGIHHAGLLPRYRILVERLAQSGLLKIICGTDTLGVGVNIPIRTVLFTRLCKFNGEKTALLTVRDFQQISGRAGRKGFDREGFVVAQAPAHVVENLRNEQKAAGDPKKLKKVVKKKPPERGFVPWNKETFNRLIESSPEPLISQFRVSHAMLLSVLGRQEEDGCKALQNLIRECHESEVSKKKLRKSAFALFRSLVERKIIELNPLRVNAHLQEDFSLNQTLSLYLLDTLLELNKESEEYPLHLLTLVEAILEDPDFILRRQLDRAKTLKMEELKLAGIEYDERIEELEKVEYPKPHRDFIYGTFNQFAAKHPWVGQENIRPKSIAREMFETFQDFSEYVREYQLQRSEGLLLRYLTDVYKTLVQTVPEESKTEGVWDLIQYFGNLVKETDASLLEEWENLRNPGSAQVSIDRADSSSSSLPERITEKEKVRLIRNGIFKLVRALAKKDYPSLLLHIEKESPLNGGNWTEALLSQQLAEFYVSGHSLIRVSPEARNPKYTKIQMNSPLEWTAVQTLVDEEGHCDWGFEVEGKFIQKENENSYSLEIKLLKVSSF